MSKLFSISAVISAASATVVACVAELVVALTTTLETVLATLAQPDSAIEAASAAKAKRFSIGAPQTFAADDGVTLVVKNVRQMTVAS